MRVTVNLNDDLVKLIDEEANRLNISRSAFICVCCSSEANAYYRNFDSQLAFESHIEKVSEEEHFIKLAGRTYDREFDE